MTPFRFDNRFVRELPADPHDSPQVRQVHGACYSRVMPTPVRKPRLLAWSREVAASLDLTEQDVMTPAFAELFAGNALAPGMEPYAACYGGHQFGRWAGQLGDGRAITLGEAINGRGERLELQLKGAGPTPYSRRADGRAVLRSSIREFLCSEAMHHLGVPTTRALSVVTTGEGVLRDMFYDGNPRLEPGAVVCRVAPSFIRFGNFEIFASRGETGLLERLVDFTIARDFPDIVGGLESRRADWFRTVCERTATLVAHWMRVGFVHGVMNTDNMSILGLTIDYGPYGWIDDFDLDWTPNTTDAGGRRYRFGHQARVAHWNLLQLANALYSSFDATEPLQAGLDRFVSAYDDASRRMNADKLGLIGFDDEDAVAVERLHRLMAQAELDMTIFFRALATLDLDAPSVGHFRDACYSEARMVEHREALDDWLRQYALRVRRDGRPGPVRRAAMNAVNPRFVLRNYLAQQAIDAAEEGDDGPVAELLDVMRQPYDEQPGRELYAAKRPDWARNRAGCSMLSCSS
ncbi:protein adenylyltransferase SelO [Rhodocyclaceae bacterium SMB388]